MLKKSYANPYRPGFISMLFILLVCGCSVLTGYKHYLPSEDFHLGLEFDYPEEWEWIYRSELSSIRAYDPRFSVTSIGEDSGSFPYTGMVRISLQENSTPEVMNGLINWYMDATEAIGGVIVEDNIIEIDGVPARCLTRRIPERLELGQDFEIFSSIVYLYTKGNIIQISLNIPYDEKDSDFVQGFEHLISSIQVVP